MNTPRIAIVISSTREGRFGDELVSLNSAVNIAMAEFTGIAYQGKTFEDYPYLAQSANAMLDDLAWWAKVLKPARNAR